MRDVLEIYFSGEKQAGVLAAAAGLLSLAAALSFLAPRLELGSFAITMGVVGLLEVTIGVGLWWKTGPQVGRLVAQLEREPARLQADESTRMTRVQRTFVYLEYGWIVLIGGAAIVAVMLKHRPTPSGVALALCLHGAFLLAFDLVAERRGAVYLAALSGARAGR